MYRSIIILYIIAFGCYVLFSRQPDYFDGERAPATIHWMKDSAAQELIPKAVFSDGKDNYSIDARYVFRQLEEGMKLEVIYDNSKPQNAVVYSWWGYWIRVGELLTSVGLLLVLFWVAVVVTKSPDEGSLKEQMEYKKERKKKYDE